MKNKYLDILSKAESFAIEQNLSDEIKLEIKKIRQEIMDFKFKIPLVGGFNAGKSSLLNKYIGIDILPEDIIPETAIASELKYGSNRIIAHKRDNTCDEFSLDGIKNINTNLYEYIEVFCDSPNLKALGKDIVLVDMPGIDSNLEMHNKAIKKYLDNGIAYIVVIDSADGCLKGSVMTFLYELASYQMNFGVAVTKADKRLEEDINDIIDVVKTDIAPLVSTPIVKSTSKYDVNTVNSINEIIRSFNKEEIFSECFKFKIIKILDRILEGLKVLLVNSNANVDDLNIQLKEINDEIYKIEKNLLNEKNELNRKINGQVQSEILNDVREVLIDNIDPLANALVNSSESFKINLNSLLRPTVINSLSSRLEGLFAVVTENIELQMDTINKLAIKNDDLKENNILTMISDKLGSNFEGGTSRPLATIITKGIGVIAGFTVPYLEGIILFLPEILGVLSKFIGGNKVDKAKERINNEIIPQVISNMSFDLGKVLNQLKDEFINELAIEVNKKKEDLNYTLEKLIRDKELKKDESDNMKYILEGEIYQVNELLCSI